MKSLLLIALFPLCSLAQTTSNSDTLTIGQINSYALHVKDSIWYLKKTDTIKVQWIMYATATGIVRKKKAKYFLRKYTVRYTTYPAFWEPQDEIGIAYFTESGVKMDLIMYKIAQSDYNNNNIIVPY